MQIESLADNLQRNPNEKKGNREESPHPQGPSSAWIRAQPSGYVFAKSLRYISDRFPKNMPAILVKSLTRFS